MVFINTIKHSYLRLKEFFLQKTLTNPVFFFTVTLLFILRQLDFKIKTQKILLYPSFLVLSGFFEPETAIIRINVSNENFCLFKRYKFSYFNFNEDFAVFAQKIQNQRYVKDTIQRDLTSSNYKKTLEFIHYFLTLEKKEMELKFLMQATLNIFFFSVFL